MPKLQVYGSVKLEVRFDIELDMTEDEFENLSQKEQDYLIETSIDWNDTMRNAEIDEVDVWEFRQKVEKING